MSGSRLPATGDDRAVLEALAARLKAQINSPRTPPYAIPQLSRELRATLAELRSLPQPRVSKIDELATRRKDRLARADADAAAGRKKRRGAGGA